MRALPESGSSIEDVRTERTFWGAVKRERFTRGFQRSSPEAQEKRRRFRVGMPRVLNMYSTGPFWRTYFEVLGLDPSFPLKFMIYFLIVVSVGGTTTITGPLLAALLLGIADVMGKYYVPQLGAFVVYALMVAILFWRPQGLFGRGATK